MEVKEFMQTKLKKQVSINVASIYWVKKKYLSLYRASMVRLYDVGYISDPTCFSEKEIRRNVRDFKLSAMVLNSSKVSITSQQADFCLATEKGIDEEGTGFLQILRDVLRYREACRDIDRFYDANDLSALGPNSKGVKKISLGVVYSGSKIYTRKPYQISIPVLECLFAQRLIGKKVVSKSLKPYIFNEALKILGIEDTGQDGLFIRGMKRNDEIRFCDIIFDGYVAITGSEKVKLENWLNDHAWNLDIDEKYQYLRMGLFTYITEQCVDFMLESRRDLLNKCADMYGEDNILFLSTDEIFCICNEESLVDYPISTFIIFAEYSDRITTNDRNTLEGYTGELYAIDKISEEGGLYSGCPIEMYDEDGVTKNLYVDFEQTSYCQSNNAVSWFACNDDVSIDFNKSCYVEGIYPKGSLEDYLFKAYGNSEAGEVIGKVPVITSVEDWKKLEEAKERVYVEVIKDSTFKDRKDGLLCLQTGNMIMARKLLGSQFSESQITAMRNAFLEGYDFNDVWLVANPVFSGEIMKKLLKGGSPSELESKKK